MNVQTVNVNNHKIRREYPAKVKGLINYMHDTMLIMQPEMYIYTQKGMHWTQIQLAWRSYAAESLSHGIFYLLNNSSIDNQITCIKYMFNKMVSEAERLADSPFTSLLNI